MSVMSKPQQAVDDQLVLQCVVELKRQLFVCAVIVVDVVVAHVEVDHAEFLVCPHYGIVPAVPDLVGFGSVAEWKTARIDGKEYGDVRIFGQVLLPAVPFVGCGSEGVW